MREETALRVRKRPSSLRKVLMRLTSRLRLSHFVRLSPKPQLAGRPLREGKTKKIRVNLSRFAQPWVGAYVIRLLHIIAAFSRPREPQELPAAPATTIFSSLNWLAQSHALARRIHVLMRGPSAPLAPSVCRPLARSLTCCAACGVTIATTSSGNQNT